MKHIKMKYGFTLIELLVVVVIIAVLTAVAVPQYKKAVLKSRYSTLMPITKSLVQSNEVYFLGHGYYADYLDELDIGAVEEESTKGVKVKLGGGNDHAYVLASYPGMDNTYVMYQQHSINYPGEVHCEAKDEKAAELCKAMGGKLDIGTTITKNYKTYVLTGIGDGYPPGYTSISDCSKARMAGYSCDVDEDENGIKTRKICISGVCLVSTYNADDEILKRVTCLPQADESCQEKEVRYYDENGYLKTAEEIGSGTHLTYTYDEFGRKTGEFYCSGINRTNGNCSTTANGTTWTYDKDGNITSQRYCTQSNQGVCSEAGADSSHQSYDYEYDDKNRLISKVECASGSVPVNSKCTSGTAEKYTYGTNGKVATATKCTIDAEGACSTYSGQWRYTYDEQTGNMTAAYDCRSVDSEGNCSRPDYLTVYSYDDDDHILTSRTCNASSLSSTTCPAATISNAYAYTTDTAGRVTSIRQCQSFNTNGTCATYYTSNTNNMRDIEYDTNGNVSKEHQCSSGACNTYTNSVEYVYSDEGLLIGKIKCDASGEVCNASMEGGYAPNDMKGYTIMGLPEY